MNKTGKILLGVVAAVGIFAVGVQYSDQVLSFVDKMKDKFGGSNPETDALKTQLQTGVGSITGVSSVASSGANVIITVDSENIKGTVMKYIQKNNLQNKPIEIVVGSASKSISTNK